MGVSLHKYIHVCMPKSYTILEFIISRICRFLEFLNFPISGNMEILKLWDIYITVLSEILEIWKYRVHEV